MQQREKQLPKITSVYYHQTQHKTKQAITVLPRSLVPPVTTSDYFAVDKIRSAFTVVRVVPMYLECLASMTPCRLILPELATQEKHE